MSGRRLRSTSTAMPVIPYRIQLANITYVYSSSKRPLNTSTAAQPHNARIDTPGVR